MSKFFNELTWDTIVWKNSHNIVRRFQRRIFKASQLNDKSKVWHLQQSLIRSPHAKLVATQRITTLNKGKNTAGVDGIIPTDSTVKLNLAKNLNLNGKASLVKRVWIPKPGKTERNFVIAFFPPTDAFVLLTSQPMLGHSKILTKSDQISSFCVVAKNRER